MNENTILDDGEFYVNRGSDPSTLYVGDGVTALKDLIPVGFGEKSILSTEEQPTGNTYLDKPIYQMVVQGTLGPTEAVDAVIATIPNATAIVKKYAQVQIGADVYDNWTINSVSTPNSWDIRGDIDSSGINLIAYWTGYASYANAPVVITIEYVK